MKRELFIHFSFWFFFFVFVAIFKHFFALPYWSFWLGGIVGTLLPDIDHIIYFYFVAPTDLTSQRFNFLLQKKEIIRMITLLYETREERKNLIFHTAFFQVIFFIVTFWFLTSSGSLFGRGLVLAFSLHLAIDQLIDLTNLKSFDNWLKYSPWYLDYKNAMNYWYMTTGLLLVFGLLL